MQFWALIVDCFREALDRKIFWVMIVISVVIAAAMACIGFDDKGISILFGLWRFDAPDYAGGNLVGRAVIGSILTKYIADMYIGWIGIIMAIIATAGIFPSLMERGAIDVVLAKPMSRIKVFGGKYLGSMVFVALQAAVFVILTLLVVGLRWHYWFPGYLWCIPLIVVLFSYLYAFCALFAVMTRSTTTAMLLTMVAWFVVWIPQTVYGVLVSLPASTGGEVKIDQKWIRASSAARWIVPKTQDIPLIAGSLIGAATATEVIMDADDPDLPENQRQRLQGSIDLEKELSNVSIAKSIGTSLLFEAVIVFLAMWRFTRQDF
ncbi:MAG: ABC transporter permease [Planctomycetota bacterium]|jgi:ABC-type transport system involved in multi-copper enzyme maturation permease subunit